MTAKSRFLASWGILGCQRSSLGSLKFDSKNIIFCFLSLSFCFCPINSNFELNIKLIYLFHVSTLVTNYFFEKNINFVLFHKLNSFTYFEFKLYFIQKRPLILKTSASLNNFFKTTIIGYLQAPVFGNIFPFPPFLEG